MNKDLEDKMKKTAERLGISQDQMPRHIAIIMDGNGRWAQHQGLPRVEGHNKGGQVVETIALDCVALGVEVLTLYSFSIENWKRPKEEIDGLMHLYVQYLVGIRNILMKNNVKLIHLGRMATLPASVRHELLETMRMTESNTGMILALALNYAGRAEIVDATKQIAQDYKDGKIQLDDIDEKLISNNLYTAKLNDPDLLIRTASELRVSNFLLWQISYSEFYVTDTLWPDFVKKDLEKAILAYANRDRRFGNIALTKK
ncbi:MAG: isoprenyl transferase [Sedimentisphaerales bacterium]|nr:isoprenyl transferase [Sedimentisphaerales bacterium]